jgi:hypothetical protein
VTRAGLVAFALFVIGALLTLAELWFAPWPYETFVKLIASDAILIALAAGWAFFAREQRETQRLKNDKTLR